MSDRTDRSLLLALIPCALLLSGCETEAPPGIALGTEQSSLDGVPMLSLSHTPTEIQAGVRGAVTLEADLTLGEDENPDGDAWFGAAADVAGFDDGSFAVFDRVRTRILMFDSTGTVTAVYGREGDAPGEYKHPFALEAVGDHLVALDGGSLTALTVLDRSGSVRGTAERTPGGDWVRPTFRSPYLRIEGAQRGTEDATRRLAAYGDTGFLVFVQLSELEDYGRSFPAPPAYLIRYGLDGRMRDTVVELVGPPTTVRDRINENIVIYEQKLYVARPVFAAGDGWLATGHGDSAHVTVRSFEGDTLLRVRWPARRRAPTDEEKVEAAQWILAIRVANFPISRRMAEEESRRERQEGIRVTAFEDTPFADSVPYLTAAYGHGNCLFLSGFSAEDWPEGTGLTWLVIDVRRGVLEAVLRFRPERAGEPLFFEREGAAMREFTARHAYTMSRDADGLFYVHRYTLPSLGCRDRPDPSPFMTHSNTGG